MKSGEFLCGIAFILALCGPARAGEDGYTAEEAIRYRNAFTIDNWDDGAPLMRYVFLNMWEFFPQVVVHRGAGPVSELPVALRDDLGRFVTKSRLGAMPLDRYVATAAVDGLLIIDDGRIVYERYPRMRAVDKHLFMSISKPYVATLIARLVDRGAVELSAPVERYLPELAGSGWQGVAVRDILDMASGIDCLEGVENAYSDPGQCNYQYEASLGWLKRTEETAATVYDHIVSLKRHRPPGEAYEYTSPTTFVLTWLVERVTGRPFAEVLGQEIWQKIGTQADGLISTSESGAPVTHGGLTATLRDMARFGLLFTPSHGLVSDEKIVSDAYLYEIQQGGRSEIYLKGLYADPENMKVDGERPKHNSYQWDWVMADGDFFKSGYGGQGLYISPARDLVFAYFGAFEKGGRSNELSHIARQMVKAGLFDGE